MKVPISKATRALCIATELKRHKRASLGVRKAKKLCEAQVAGPEKAKAR